MRLARSCPPLGVSVLLEEVTWTEEEEAEVTQIIREIEAEGAEKVPEEGSEECEEDSERGEGERN